MTERLDPAGTCLLLFDFLRGHVERDEESRRRYVPVVANAAQLLAAARRTRSMVAFSKVDHRADRATSATTLRDTDNRLRPLDPGNLKAQMPLITRGTFEAEIVPSLAPLEDEYVVPKHRWSAFHGTYLDLALRTRGIDTIVLCGGSTDVGIAATAFSARDLDYNLVIVPDACTSPETDNHDQLIGRVFPRMSRVRTTAQVLAMWP